jgi:aromatic-L-amino-acid/L-tryptophan decarboxylase
VSAQEYPLEPTPDEMRAMAASAIELLVGFVARLPQAPAADLEGANELARTLRGLRPLEEPTAFADNLSTVERAASKAIDTAAPGYLAYIPGGGIFTAALGDLLADGLNRFTSIAAVAPALTAIEASVIEWLCELFAFPTGSGGVLTTGGSLANFGAVIVARTALGEAFGDGTIYMSEQAHHSVARAAQLAGFSSAALRPIECDSDLRIDVRALERQIVEDRRRGLRPCLVVATAGTTNTGVIDSLSAIADIAQQEGIHFHADAAYGGFFRLTERGCDRLTGIERADSITLDPHKGLFLPYGTGCLLVRDRELLRRAHAMGAEYLQDLQADELPDFADLSPELSRDNRGLRVWLPLHLHGIAAFRGALDEKLDLAALVHERLSEVSELELAGRPELSTVAFRLRDTDDANRALLERINVSKRVFVSSTQIAGRVWLRVSILSHRTHRDRIEEAIAIIVDAVSTESRS